MLLYGDPKVGKSYAALQLACCVTSGVEWLGFGVPEPRKVVYVQLDTPRSLWADRVQTLAESGYPVEGIHFADLETLETHPFNILDPDHFCILRDALQPIGAGVIIFDTIREAHRGDEDKSGDMQDVVAHFNAACKPASIIFISHARKGSPDPKAQRDQMNDSRGSNYVVGKVDSIVRFSHSSARFVSRTMEEHTLKLERLDDGTWRQPSKEFENLAAVVVKNNEGASVRQLARLLHENFPERTEYACRAWLRRNVKPASAATLQ